MKYAARLSLALLVLFLVALSACDGGGTGANASATIAYDNKPGHILIQLFPEPGFVLPHVNALPRWTLYGDGTLVMRPATGTQLEQAQLSASDVQQVLDVVVRQQAFFSSTQSSYGTMMPDVGATQLTVNAQSQHKMVRLLREPSAGQTPDSETQHVFAIEHYLLQYLPAHVQPYVPAGVALLVRPSNTLNLPAAWPYQDISLANVAAQECNYTTVNASCEQAASANVTTQGCGPTQQASCSQHASGLFPVYGTRGLDMLKRWPASRLVSVQEQNKNYQLIIWPLLPDALVQQPDGSHGILITGTPSGRAPLLAGPGSGTPLAH